VLYFDSYNFFDDKESRHCEQSNEYTAWSV
jgi:hypothetical protein